MGETNLEKSFATMCVCVRARACARACVRGHVCMCVYVCAYIDTQTHIHTHTHAHFLLLLVSMLLTRKQNNWNVKSWILILYHVFPISMSMSEIQIGPSDKNAFIQVQHPVSQIYIKS